MRLALRSDLAAIVSRPERRNQAEELLPDCGLRPRAVPGTIPALSAKPAREHQNQRPGVRAQVFIGTTMDRER